MQDLLKEKRFIMIIIGSVILVIGGMWFYYHQNNDNMLVLDQNPVEKDENLESSELGATEEKEENTDEAPKEIMVHIIGQVKNPGVILLEEGSRLIEAIEQLGGPLEEADLDAVNLSQKLIDEQKIYIPKKGETPPETLTASNDPFNTNQEQDGSININTCSQEELKTLPGIGEVISENIIHYRETNGAFKSIEDIKKVNRIGDKIFDDIKDRIRV